MSAMTSQITCFKKQKGSLIDLCLVSNTLRFKKALNLDCWLSDWHNFICITTKLSVPCQKPSVIMYRSFKNSVDDDLYHLLESLNFDNKDAIDTCFKHFVDCLDDIVNYHAPLKTKTTRKNNVPYINNKWRKVMYTWGTWCVILKINILVLKIMNGTESTETNVSISEKCQKSSTSLSDAKVVKKINISGLLSNHLLALGMIPI